MKPKQFLLLLLVVAVALVLLWRHIFFAHAQQQPYRCLADVNLGELVKSEGLPQSPPQAWESSARQESQENRFFEGEQEIRGLIVDNPGPWVGRLCDRLKAQLAKRCDVSELWTGIEHCAAEVQSPNAAVTGPDGVYKLRPVAGRLNLFVSRAEKGKTNLVLTTTEWAQ
jgi:hypothetical protein